MTPPACVFGGRIGSAKLVASLGGRDPGSAAEADLLRKKVYTLSGENNEQEDDYQAHQGPTGRLQP